MRAVVDRPEGTGDTGDPPRSRPLVLVGSKEQESRQSDADLVAALRLDAAWARRAIWERYHPDVRRYLARALGSSQAEVDDLAQEVFLRIFSRRNAIREPKALREFAMSVAVRVLKWELRRRWVRRKVRLSDSGDLPEVALDRGLQEEARDAIRRCYRILDTLSGRERTAFTLRYLEEMTLEEIATTMRVSLSTAKRLVSRSAAQVADRAGSDSDLSRYFADKASKGPQDGNGNHER